MDFTSFLAQYLPPPVVGFILGFASGITVGVFFSKPFCAYLMAGRRLRRADREAERQRREDAAKRRLESCRQRHEAEAHRAFIAARIERGVHINDAGYIVDANGKAYCPVCFDRGRLVEVREVNRVFLCPECGHEI